MSGVIQLLQLCTIINMVKVGLAKLFKDYLGFKLLFGIFTLVLVIEELELFVFEKPTFTSTSRQKLGDKVIFY